MATIGSLTAKINADTSGLQAGLRKSENLMRGFGRGISSVTRSVFSLQGAVLGLAGGYGVKALSDSFIDAANTSDMLRVRLRYLLGSVEEGNRLFKEMSSYAGRVPFEFKDVMEAATTLSGIMRGGVDEVKEWMPLIGDLAATTGLTLRDTTSQVVRMYSAGAASADMFRERGVLAMLGFQAGVSYSAEETRKKMFEAWNKADSQFKGATEGLAQTWTGLMSMFSDKWFQFRNAVMDAGPFDILKRGLSEVLAAINKLEAEGKLKEWAAITAQGMLYLARSALELVKVFAYLPEAAILIKQGFQVLTVAGLALTEVFVKAAKAVAIFQQLTAMPTERAQLEETIISLEVFDGVLDEMQESQRDTMSGTMETKKALELYRIAIQGNIDEMLKWIEANKELNKTQESVAGKSGPRQLRPVISETKQEIAAREKLEKTVSDRIKELTLSTLDYQIWALDEYVKELRQKKVDETLIVQLAEAEKQKIYADAMQERMDIMAGIEDSLATAGMSDYQKQIYAVEQEYAKLTQTIEAYGENVTWVNDMLAKAEKDKADDIEKINKDIHDDMLREQKKALDESLKYWEEMATDIKATMSDTLVAMWSDETEEIEQIWESLWKRLKKSYADMMTENISGVINNVLKTDAVGGIFDKLGLGGFAKAWEETRTPPSLKVLDEQYVLQKGQHKTQLAILEALGVTNKSPVSTISGGSQFSGADLIDMTTTKIGSLLDTLLKRNQKQPIPEIQITASDMSDALDFTPLERDMSTITEQTKDYCDALDDASTKTLGWGDRFSNFFGVQGKKGIIQGNWGGVAGGIAGGVGLYQTITRQRTGTTSDKVGGALSGAASGAMAGTMIMPGWGTAIGAVVGGLAGAFGGSDDQAEEERDIERQKEFYEELEQIASTTYSHLNDMLADFDSTISSHTIESIEDLDDISNAQSRIMEGYGESMHMLQREAELTGTATQGTSRQMLAQMQRVVDEVPAMSNSFSAIKAKIEDTFTKDVLQDFEDGVISLNEAITTLTRQGLSQFESQAELMGDGYNELMLMMQDTIPLIDSSSVHFEELNDTLADVRDKAEQIPESMGKIKTAVIEIIDYTTYMTNVFQSIVNVMEDIEGLSGAIEDFSTAWKEADFEGMADALKKIEDVASQLTSVFSQLAADYVWLGNWDLSSQFSELSAFFGKITASIMTVRVFLEMLGIWDDVTIGLLKVWRDFLILLDKFVKIDLSEKIADIDDQLATLGASADATLDKWELFNESLEKMTPQEIIDDLVESAREWEKISFEKEFGSVNADMRDITDSLTYTLMEIQELGERATELKDDTLLALADMLLDKSLEAYIEQIEKYFEELLNSFDDLISQVSSSISQVKRDIMDIEYSLAETADARLESLPLLAASFDEGLADIDRRIGEWAGSRGGWQNMGMGADEDPQDYLDDMSELHDLILERYEMEKERITELYQIQIDYYQEMKAAYESLRDQVKDIITDISTSGMNQGDIFERMTTMWDTIMGLQAQAGALPAGSERAGIESQIAGLLRDYLGMAEEAYTRPSLEYQGIYDTVMGMLEGLLSGAEENIGIADAKIIVLQEAMVSELKELRDKTIGELKNIQGFIDDAEATLNGIRDTAIANLQTAVENLGTDMHTAAVESHATNTWLSWVLGVLKEIKGKKWHWEEGKGWAYYQHGTSYVPETGPAILHKGEAVIPADRNTTGTMTVPITLNYTGNAGRADVDNMLALIQNDIKYGKTGMILKEQIRRVE